MLPLIYVILCCFSKHIRKKKQPSNIIILIGTPALLCTYTSVMLKRNTWKMRCTTNACWCGAAGAQQHCCRQAAACLLRMQVPTAPASLHTSVWGKEGGFYRKWGITDHKDMVSVPHRSRSAVNSMKATCNERSMSASTFSISLWQIMTALPAPDLISQINSERLRREVAGKDFGVDFQGEEREFSVKISILTFWTNKPFSWRCDMHMGHGTQSFPGLGQTLAALVMLCSSARCQVRVVHAAQKPGYIQNHLCGQGVSWKKTDKKQPYQNQK